jgi:tetratricopeptide (TPR) repeat protein
MPPHILLLFCFFGSADEPITEARLRAGRALAYEGRSQWREALADYDAALQLAAAGGESPDPYIINARGNCLNSLGEWAGAREDYLASSQLFQQAKGFRGRGGTTTQRLDGAIFAASNAALMLAQVGDEDGALREFEKIARRAPGSSDSRAALAALYWRRGDGQRAEDAWHFACENISAGCSKYQDKKWLAEVRRWPPVMVAHLQDFLALARPAA